MSVEMDKQAASEHLEKLYKALAEAHDSVIESLLRIQENADGLSDKDRDWIDNEVVFHDCVLGFLKRYDNADQCAYQSHLGYSAHLAALRKRRIMREFNDRTIWLTKSLLDLSHENN